MSLTSSGRKSDIRKLFKPLTILIGLTLFVSAIIIVSWFSTEGTGIRNAAAKMSLRLNARREQALESAVNADMITLNMAQDRCSRIEGHPCSESELVPTYMSRIPTPPEGRYFLAHNAWNWERVVKEHAPR